MKIAKIYNNSLALATRDDGSEIIVASKGVRFKYAVGAEIPEAEIQKKYILADEKASVDLLTLLKEIPAEYLETAEKIIQYGNQKLSTLHDFIYVTLTDHIFFSAARLRENDNFQNRLFYELNYLYPEEYQVGVRALEIIEAELGLQFPKEEAGNIAFHFVNARQDANNMVKVRKEIKTVQDIINIVKRFYMVEFDTADSNYRRFITHLNFFVQRMMEGEALESGDIDIFDKIKDKYTKAYACVKLIKEYIQKVFNYSLSLDEQVYLMIHVNRMTQN